MHYVYRLSMLFLPFWRQALTKQPWLAQNSHCRVGWPTPPKKWGRDMSHYIWQSVVQAGLEHRVFLPLPFGISYQYEPWQLAISFNCLVYYIDMLNFICVFLYVWTSIYYHESGYYKYAFKSSYRYIPLLILVDIYKQNCWIVNQTYA